MSALDLRQGLGALSQASIGSTFGNLSGVFPGGTSGSGPSNDCQVSSGAGAMDVVVNGGHYGVDRGSAGLYLGEVTGAVTVTHAASNPTNPRIDYVVIRTRDPGVDVGVTESAKVVILPGNPAAVPVEPAAQMTSGDLLLAAVTIRANTSSVIGTDISERRLYIVSRGGITPVTGIDSRNGAYEGQYRDDLASNALQRWSGTAWQTVASPAAWTAFTPKLYSEGAGECNLGSTAAGAKAAGAFQLIGKNLRVRYLFEARRPCNLGFGNIYTLLPIGLYSAAGVADHHGRAQLNTQPPGGAYNEWLGDSALGSNANRIYPKFNKTFTDNTLGIYRVAASAGGTGSGIPVIPGENSDPLRGLGINLECEVQ